jgi:hypothetical protein
MSWAEIATQVVREVARQRGCALDSLSLDGVETETGPDGAETVRVLVSARFSPVPDEIPFELAS